MPRGIRRFRTAGPRSARAHPSSISASPTRRSTRSAAATPPASRPGRASRAAGSASATASAPVRRRRRPPDPNTPRARKPAGPWRFLPPKFRARAADSSPMAGEPDMGRTFRRLLGPLVGAAVIVGLYRYGRVDLRRDPVGALRGIAVKHPSIRNDIPLERLGPPCDEGDGDACTDLGLAVESVRDELPPTSFPACLDHALFARACAQRSWRGCRELSQRAKLGDCGAIDIATARDVLDAACRRLVFPACDALAQL